MAEKKYSADDILKLFNKLNKKIEELTCFVKECCAKIPVNVGTGIGLFKKFNQNKWEFKSLLPGSNITITETNNEVIISSGVQPVDCDDIKDCLGISPLGDPNKYLNEQGDWQTITIPPNFINSVSDTATIDLTVTGTTLSADFASMNISQFTNDSGYLNQTAADLLYYPLTNPSNFISLTSLSAGAGISYNNLTGVITNSAPDQTVTLNAGTGISISGTYPTFTITNNSVFTSPLTTKGDIYVRNATVDTRLPVGLDTQVLVADSSTTTGLKWATNTAPIPLGYYGAWQDVNTQTAAASNVGYPMIFNTVDLSNGVTMVSDGSNLTRITFANTGIYNIQFSVQIQNTDNTEHDVTIWIRKNGVDVPGSAGFVQVPKRKAAGAGNEGHVVVGWNYVLSIVGGEYYQLVWSTTNHTNVTLQYYAAGNPPPSTASTLVTVTQQSGIMAGTGLTAINSLTNAVQTLVTGTSGTDFNISSVGSTHTFNLPTASATIRGALSATDWSTFNGKQNAITLTTTGNSGASTFSSNTLNVPNYTLSGLGGVPTSRTLTINGTTQDLSADRTWSVGTVTSVAALTLGTSGVDLSSTVANSTTTPVITLNVPTASATSRGALSAADWSIFNNKVTSVSAGTGITISGTTTPTVAAKRFYQTATTSASTNSATQFLLASILIPANTVTVGSSIKISYVFSRDNTTNTAVPFVNFNTSNSLPATNINSNNITGTNRALYGNKYGVVRTLSGSNNTEFGAQGVTADIGQGFAIAVPVLYTINWTVDIYIIFSASTAAAGTTCTFHYGEVLIEKI